MPSLRHQLAAFAFACLLPQARCVCESFGIDFQSGGTYFQNSLSTDPFTALQEFEGCDVDVSNNILVDPAGDQSECSTTPLTPDDTPQLVNCTQWPKNTLTTGDWSLLIISNNGDGNPIAYERDFSLTVGPQQTLTVTPTVTVTSISIPAVSTTTLSTSTVTTTIPASTVFGGAAGTVTVTPPPSSILLLKGILTLTHTTSAVSAFSTETTVPASCSAQTTTASADPIASVLPTILGSLDNVVASLLGSSILKARAPEPTDLLGSAKFRRAVVEGRTPDADMKAAFVKDRRERLAKQALNKRAPDLPTVTVTATSIITSAVTSIAPTATATVVSTVFTTSTFTPPPIDDQSTITAPASTVTGTLWLPLTVVTTTVTLITT